MRLWFFFFWKINRQYRLWAIQYSSSKWQLTYFYFYPWLKTSSIRSMTQFLVHSYFVVDFFLLTSTNSTYLGGKIYMSSSVNDWFSSLHAHRVDYEHTICYKHSHSWGLSNASTISTRILAHSSLCVREDASCCLVTFCLDRLLALRPVESLFLKLFFFLTFRQAYNQVINYIIPEQGWCKRNYTYYIYTHNCVIYRTLN